MNCDEVFLNLIYLNNSRMKVVLFWFGKLAVFKQTICSDLWNSGTFGNRYGAKFL